VEAKVSAGVGLAQFFTAAIGKECKEVWRRAIVTSSRVNPTDKSATRLQAVCRAGVQMLKVEAEQLRSRISKPRTRLRSSSLRCVCSEAAAAAAVWNLSQRRHHLSLNLNRAFSVNWVHCLLFWSRTCARDSEDAPCSPDASLVS
jgi:hypothetical protein